MYAGLESAGVLNSSCSSWFAIKQGVRQGGVLSTLLYLVFINDLLEQLETSEHGAKLMSISSGCPTLADDLTCICTSPNALHHQLQIVNVFAKQWRYRINCSKSCVLVFGNRSRNKPQTKHSWQIGGDIIPELDTVTHLGIIKSTRNASAVRTKHASRKGRGAFFALAGTGARPRGLYPATSVSLYKRIVLPYVLYGCELWNDLNTRDIHDLNTSQHLVAKKIQ